MKEHPILFSAPMVRALLDGSKTQTRRVVKAKHLPFIENLLGGLLDDKWSQRPLPYGKPGDRLWVREAWSIEMLGAFGTDKGYDRTYELRFRADDAEREIHVAPGEPDPYIKLYDSQRGAWRPSIHMPRWASRILLEVVIVRVERLQAISGVDVLAEGVKRDRAGGHFIDGTDARYTAAVGAPASDAFSALWESINGAGSWDANPWCWVIEFQWVSP
jgi:hypothetical protein